MGRWKAVTRKMVRMSQEERGTPPVKSARVWTKASARRPAALPLAASPEAAGSAAAPPVPTAQDSLCLMRDGALRPSQAWGAPAGEHYSTRQIAKQLK